MDSQSTIRRAVRFASIAVGVGLWSGCVDSPTEVSDPSAPTPPDLTSQSQAVQAAIEVQERHNPTLMRTPGVVGTAVGLLPSGEIGVKLFLARDDVPGLPTRLDGIPVGAEVTGLIFAGADPKTKARPAFAGFSVGHPNITAGTIGAKVVDGSGDRFILSNNHVLANSNNASVGDPTLQPGPADGGTLADQIGTLAAFEVIDFSGAPNTIDAALASVPSADLINGTPVPDGYGVPNTAIYGDANADGFFDNVTSLIGLPVQKYGRTTELTTGQITAVNATLDVCYDGFLFICFLLARFEHQLVIDVVGFSGGGDSGSLIVTNDASAFPVGLLFAGSETTTIANRIDLVLDHFNVSIDGEDPPPPTPLTDIAIVDVDGPTSLLGGDATDIMVTVQNVGNQDVASTFDVALHDDTDGGDIGTQSVTGLAAGESQVLTFNWNTGGASFGNHVLSASHNFPDEDASNDDGSLNVEVLDPSAPVGFHIGDLDGTPSNDGRTWSAVVEVEVHGPDHTPLNGVTVTGVWDQSGLASTVCTTGELGGNGTCIFLFPSLRKNVQSVTFVVVDATMAGETYLSASNHDPDGDSDGMAITVPKP